jgi:hypothetical protein
MSNTPYLVSSPPSSVALPSFPGHPGPSKLIDDHFGGSLTRKRTNRGTRKEFAKGGPCVYIFARYSALTVDGCDVAQVTIDVLPDVALLDIFDFYMDEEHIDSWYTLVHVCRKWRNIVFGSPRRLKLRLYYKAKKPVRVMLDVWPALPIIVKVHNREMWDIDHIVAALEHNDRICRLDLIDIPSSQVDKVLPAMQQPFPALTHLRLGYGDELTPVQPDSFLGGSAPRLQYLILNCIPFPELPKLLLSANHLVVLALRNIPPSGYISPVALVTGLSVLTCLEILNITFKSPLSRLVQKTRRPPPQTRTLLPVLSAFLFIGACEYLEDLVAQIDAPLLDRFIMTFFQQQTFDTPHLARFIRRTPKFEAHDEAHVFFSDHDALISFSQTHARKLELRISCRRPNLQLSSLAQICSSSFPLAFIPVVKSLHILQDEFSPLYWPDDIESSQWLALLRPFTAVKSLYISRRLVPGIAPALQELVGEGVTEALPSLQTLFLEEPLPSEPVQEAIWRFVGARQLAGHNIIMSCCKFEVR